MSHLSLLRRILTGAAAASFIKVAGIGIAFLFLLVMARTMTAEAFGIFAAGLSIALIAGPAATLGQHTAVLRFWPALDEVYGRSVADHAIRRAFILTTTGAFALLMGGVALSLSGVRLDAFGDDPQIWMMIAVLSAALALSEVALSALRAQGDIVWALMPKDVLWRSLVMILVLAFGVSLTANHALAITAAVLAMLTLAQMIRVYSLTPSLLQRRLVDSLPSEERAAMRHAQWGVWGNAIVGPIQQQGATVIVALVLGPIEAGAFFAASRLANLLSIVLVGANQVSSPMLARAWRAGRIDEVQAIASLTAAAAFIAAFLGFLIFAIFGRTALSFFNPIYTEAYWGLIVLAVAQLVNTACGPNGMLLLMAGEERLLLIIKTTGVVVHIGAIATLALAFGIIGAGIGVLISTAYWNIAAVVGCLKRLGVRPMNLHQFNDGLRSLMAPDYGKAGTRDR